MPLVFHVSSQVTRVETTPGPWCHRVADRVDTQVQLFRGLDELLEGPASASVPRAKRMPRFFPARTLLRPRPY